MSSHFFVGEEAADVQGVPSVVTPSLDPAYLPDVLDPVETIRHMPANGSPPTSPISFDAMYKPPAHSVKDLEVRNPHMRDMHIEFKEKPHIYVCHKQPYETSVTGVVSEFCGTFDADAVITKMRAAAREAWPRRAYAIGVVAYSLDMRQDALASLQRLMIFDTQTEMTLYAGIGPPPGPGDEAWARDWIMRAVLPKCSKRISFSTIQIFSYDREMTNEEIKKAWRDNAVQKSNMGTEAHYCMELWLNSKPCRNTPELQQGLSFLREILVPLGVVAHRTEMEIFADAEGVAGSIDFVGRLPNGEFIICDWKRTAAHEIHSPWRKRMAPPLHHLDDTDVCRFSLQLSMYAYILETYYGWPVRALCMVSIHPEHSFHTFSPYLQEEVAFLMAKRRERVAAKLRFEIEWEDGRMKDIPVPICSLSGNIAWNPARDPHGAVVDEKVALVHHEDMKLVQDGELTSNVNDLLRMVTVVEESAEERKLKHAQPWSRRIPRNGHHSYVDCHSI
jgi:hypothetical protein